MCTDIFRGASSSYRSVSMMSPITAQTAMASFPGSVLAGRWACQRHGLRAYPAGADREGHDLFVYLPTRWARVHRSVPAKI